MVWAGTWDTSTRIASTPPARGCGTSSSRGSRWGVLSNQGACAIAKSYEMKARGVTTSMPIWDALPLCPEGIFVKRDFEWYEVLSRRILDIVRSFSPAMEYYSIDEMFFDAQAMLLDDAKVLQQ